MFEYALNFYDNYFLLFYFFLIIAAVIEGPITILAFSLFAVNLGISFFEVLIFSFIGEFIGDLLHYSVGRFFRVNIFKNKNFSILEKAEKRLKERSLFDQLVVIKYTPPITSIGLLYMGYKKIDFLRFIKNISIFTVFNGIIITSIGYNFGYLFKDKTEFLHIIVLLFLSFILVYFLLKVVVRYIIKKIYE